MNNFFLGYDARDTQAQGDSAMVLESLYYRKCGEMRTPRKKRIERPA